MILLINEITELCGLEPGYLNSVNSNWYEDGEQAVGWHADDEYLFQTKDKKVTIVSSRNFQMRRFYTQDDLSLDRKLDAGDLLIMAGRCQQVFQHQITKRPGDAGARFNLTFRHICNHGRGCRHSGY